MIEGRRVHLVDRRGRSGDADVVDQHIEPAHPGGHLGEELVDRGRVGDVADNVGGSRRIRVDHQHLGAALFSRAAIAAPMPDPPPVTSARSPSSSSIASSHSWLCRAASRLGYS